MCVLYVLDLVVIYLEHNKTQVSRIQQTTSVHDLVFMTKF